MEIEEKLLEKWKVLRSPEDTGKMVEKLDGSYPELFNRAFKNGRCNDEVFKVMAEFYEEKAEFVKEFL